MCHEADYNIIFFIRIHICKKKKNMNKKGI